MQASKLAMKLSNTESLISPEDLGFKCLRIITTVVGRPLAETHVHEASSKALECSFARTGHWR